MPSKSHSKIASRKCGLMLSGLVSYEVGLELQHNAKALVASGEWDGIVILLEHQPVITIGNGGGINNVKRPVDELKLQGVDVINTDRGGNITCHNPGQLIGYPVLNLTKWQQDVHWYVHMLEETLIRSLAKYGLSTGRKSRYSGVWLADKKIAAIGVSVRKWITGHGFALNVHNDLGLFGEIVPCGISEFGVTSMIDNCIGAEIMDVYGTVVSQFKKVFQCRLDEIT